MPTHLIWFFGEGDATNAGAARRPGLDLYDHFTSKFFCRHNRIIRGRGGLAARNLKAVGGKNFFTLILVQSCHRACYFG